MKQHCKKCKINKNIPFVDCDCDGYHTFDELYEHRYVLFIALCKSLGFHDYVIWKSKLQSDGKMYAGYFIAGIEQDKGKQITYHLPLKYWEELKYIKILNKAPEYDGHTEDDVLNRLLTL